MKKSDFSYVLPESLIAQQPLAERCASRLLCVEPDLVDRQFREFIDLLQPNDLLVLNNTRVIPARLFGKKSTGGRLEILIERVVNDYQAVAHVRTSKSPTAGAVISLEGGYHCQVSGREADLFVLEFNDGFSVQHVLTAVGHIPLPPYIAREETLEDHSRYQTVFAEQAGAVAAPTAGLHFDESLMSAIKARGIHTATVTLHVGSGTFRPVKVENLSEHIMHKEYFEVPEMTVEAVKQTKAKGGRVIAIGTTAVRALESASIEGELTACLGETNLFITPGYQFRCVDAMLTNFHLPESTLLMLVCAFSGYDKVMIAYHHAIKQHYRFFSYGDAMFLTP